MIRTYRCALILFLCTSSVFGIDVELSGRLDNLYWASTRGDDTAGYTYKAAELFWNLEGSMNQNLDENLSFKGGWKVDPVLRSRIYSELAFNLDSLSLKFIPFLGAFNATQKWFNPGMEALVEYTWPGVLFARGGFLTTFGPVAKAGDYYLSAQTLTLGTVMENGIISLTIEDKSATFRVQDNLSTVDASTKYWLDTEMFLKNFPLRWAILTGYQITSRSYLSTSEVTTTIHSPLIGARGSWDFGSGTVVYAQAESALFNLGWNSTIMELPASALVFQAVAGVRYHW